LSLTATVENGALRLGTDDKGVRSGAYLLKFSYQTDLLSRGLIRQDGAAVDLRWVGPRFGDGIDSARVLFRIPKAPQAPRLPKVESVDGKLGIAEEYDGVFLSAARPAGDKDELEVVRPYVAKGEPVVWRAQVDVRALELLKEAPHDPRPAPAPLPPRSTHDGDTVWVIVLAVLVGSLYGGLVMKKCRYVLEGAVLRGTKPRPLVRLAGAWRAVLAGSALCAATAMLLASSFSILVGLFVVIAIACATHLPPLAAQARRGPGTWRKVKISEAFAGAASESLPGAWLDIGRGSGFCLFIAVAACLMVVASRAFLHVPEKGALILLEALALVPVFCTGRAIEFPPASRRLSKAFLLATYRSLRRHQELSVKLIARFQQGMTQADEARLALSPATNLAGFRGIELCCELRQSWGGPLLLPVILVRAVDASPSYEALPRSLSWMRGRTSDERVAVIHPKFADRRSTLEVIDGLCSILRQAPASEGAQRASSAKLSGKGDRAAKARTVASPLHAM
jgi:hypothetical protein